MAASTLKPDQFQRAHDEAWAPLSLLALQGQAAAIEQSMAAAAEAHHPARTAVQVLCARQGTEALFGSLCATFSLSYTADSNTLCRT